MKLFVTLSLLLVSTSLWACPMCGGMDTDEGNSYVTYVLMGFILLTYIPMYMFYKVIKKGHIADRNKLASPAFEKEV